MAHDDVHQFLSDRESDRQWELGTRVRVYLRDGPMTCPGGEPISWAWLQARRPRPPVLTPAGSTQRKRPRGEASGLATAAAPSQKKAKASRLQRAKDVPGDTVSSRIAKEPGSPDEETQAAGQEGNEARAEDTAEQNDPSTAKTERARDHQARGNPQNAKEAERAQCHGHDKSGAEPESHRAATPTPMKSKPEPAASDASGTAANVVECSLQWMHLHQSLLQVMWAQQAWAPPPQHQRDGQAAPGRQHRACHWRGCWNFVAPGPGGARPEAAMVTAVGRRPGRA